jgi:hypothetical protein
MLDYSDISRLAPNASTNLGHSFPPPDHLNFEIAYSFRGVPQIPGRITTIAVSYYQRPRKSFPFNPFSSRQYDNVCTTFHVEHFFTMFHVEHSD